MFVWWNASVSWSWPSSHRLCACPCEYNDKQVILSTDAVFRYHYWYIYTCRHWRCCLGKDTCQWEICKVLPGKQTTFAVNLYKLHTCLHWWSRTAVVGKTKGFVSKDYYVLDQAFTNRMCWMMLCGFKHHINIQWLSCGKVLPMCMSCWRRWSQLNQGAVEVMSNVQGWHTWQI